MNRMRDAAPWLEEQGGRDRERKAIERVLAFRLTAAAAAYRVPIDVEDVEQLFSLASASGREQIAEDMALAIAATLDYAQNVASATPVEQRPQIGVLNQIGWKKPADWDAPLPYVAEQAKTGQRKGEWYCCPPYHFYLGVMAGYFNKGGSDRSDTIISFNYDTTVEDALRSLGVRFSYGFSGKTVNFGPDSGGFVSEEDASRRTLRLLKIHGSVNWAIPGKVGQKLTLYGGYEQVRTQNLSPFLVPPTWRKVFTGQLADIWDSAVDALRTATRIIVLGYSIPVTDQHFKYLLGAGLQDNITLRKVFFVNPALSEENERRKLEGRLFDSPGLFRRDHVEQGVIELIPTDTKEFLTGPHDIHAREPYRERMGRSMNPKSYTGDDAPFRFSDRPQSLGAWR